MGFRVIDILMRLFIIQTHRHDVTMSDKISQKVCGDVCQ